MHWHSFRNRLQVLWRRRAFEDDLAQELNAHIELQARKHMMQGVDLREAHRLARIEFGAMEQAREACREIDRWHWIDEGVRNGRQCFRSLAQSPGFVLISLLLLTVGIGANVAVFSVVDALFLRPLPVPYADGLVQISSTDRQGHTGGLFSPVLDELSHNRAFQGACGVATHYEAVEIEGTLRNLGTAAFSGGCFQTLGLPAQLGRVLTPNDDQIGAERVAVITDSIWHSQWGGRPDVLGRSLRIGSDEFTIIGVTGKPFTGLLLGFPEPIMIPLLQQPDFLPDGSRRTSYYVNVLARRSPQTSEAQALASIVAQRRSILEQSAPHHFNAARRKEYLARSLSLSSAASGFDYFLRRRFAQPLYAIFGLCGAMLLMACVNLSSLLLARSLRRQREIAVRLALGAGCGHVVGILALENVFLVLAGTALGILTGLGIARTILARGGQIFGNFDLHLGFDARVVFFVFATLLTVVGAFLAVSLWQARHLASADVLKQSGRGVIAPNTSAQRALVAAQIALTLALVTGSALFGASVKNMYRIDFGIQPRNVWVARLSPRPGGYRNPNYWNAHAGAYYRRLLEQIEALPNTVFATFTDTVPFFGGGYQTTIALIEGGQAEREMQTHTVGVADGYFTTLGAKIIAGADFRRAEGAANEPSVILSESLARHFGNRQALLGQHVRIGTQPDLQRLKVIGIAADMDLSFADLNDTKPFTAFIDFWQHQNLQGYPALLIKTRSAALDAAAIRQIVEKDGHEFVERLSAISTEMDNALVENRFLAYLSTVFGMLALGMAAVGLFGLLSYQVANRTAEIGIRMALGAKQSQIRWLILGQIMRLLLFGSLAGIVLTFAVQRLIAGLLYGVSVYNPVILFSALAVLVLTALAAAWLPARRASTIDPINALRHE